MGLSRIEVGNGGGEEMVLEESSRENILPFFLIFPFLPPYLRHTQGAGPGEADVQGCVAGCGGGRRRKS